MAPKPKRSSRQTIVRIFAIIATTALIAASFLIWHTGIDKLTQVYVEGRFFDRIFAKLDTAYDDISYRLFWRNFGRDHWKAEDADERARLPLFKTIPAATQDQLTPAGPPPALSDITTWHRSHGDASSSHFSNLSQINPQNVSQLKVAWVFRSKSGTSTVQCNPVIAQGLLFTATGGHEIVALDAATGKERWRYTSPIKFPAKRGLVWWGGNSDHAPRLYFPAGNRLYALNAKTGKPVKEFGNGGSVRSSAIGKIAPAIAGDTLVHANHTPAVEGYDIVTGRLLWRTGLLEAGKVSRPGGKRFKLEGGHPWGGMALDARRGIAFITTGNPGPVLVGVRRPGDNAHSVSLVAIDIATGKKLWAFQDVRHDIWDLDIPAPPVLTSITRNGRAIDVVAAVTKTGNTLLLDRVSGKPVFDFRLKRAPVSTLPGERTSPYQPDLKLPEPFSKQVFGLQQVTDIGVENTRSVMDILQRANFGFFQPHELGVPTVFFGLHGGAEWPGAATNPNTGMLFVAANDVPYMATVIDPASAFDESTLPKTPGRTVYLSKCAQCHGTNREGAGGPSLLWANLYHSESKIRSIVRQGRKQMPPIDGLNGKQLDALIGYLHARDQLIQSQKTNTAKTSLHSYVRSSYKRLEDFEGFPGSRPPWGTLNALDLNTGKLKWKVPLGEYRELTRRGITKTGTINFGGPVVTASGLVFVSGTADRKIRAFDARSGAELWAHELPFVGSAPPAIYQIDGRQFIVIPATGGGTLKIYDDTILEGDAFIAFALPVPGPTTSP